MTSYDLNPPSGSMEVGALYIFEGLCAMPTVFVCC